MFHLSNGHGILSLNTDWQEFISWIRKVNSSSACTCRCVISRQGNNQGSEFAAVSVPVFSSPRQCLPNCRNWVCKTDAASAAPYPPAQRKESLLSSLKLARWPCFSSLPFSVSTKFPARIFRPSELVYAVCNKCCWNQSSELGRDCGVEIWPIVRLLF